MLKWWTVIGNCNWTLYLGSSPKSHPKQSVSNEAGRADVVWEQSERKLFTCWMKCHFSPYSKVWHNRNWPNHIRTKKSLCHFSSFHSPPFAELFANLPFTTEIRLDEQKPIIYSFSRETQRICIVRPKQLRSIQRLFTVFGYDLGVRNCKSSVVIKTFLRRWHVLLYNFRLNKKDADVNTRTWIV